MPKEYTALTHALRHYHPDWSDRQIKGMAAAIFYKRYGITVNQSHELMVKGKWEEYKRKHHLPIKKKKGKGWKGEKQRHSLAARGVKSN
jgi:hypothetical protein